MARLDVVRRRFDPALTGHRRRLEFRRTPGAPETFTCHIVFGRTIGIVWLRFHFGHLFPRSTVFPLSAWGAIRFRGAAGARNLGGGSRDAPNLCRCCGVDLALCMHWSGREKFEVPAKR